MQIWCFGTFLKLYFSAQESHSNIKIIYSDSLEACHSEYPIIKSKNVKLKKEFSRRFQKECFLNSKRSIYKKLESGFCHRTEWFLPCVDIMNNKKVMNKRCN